MPLHPRYDPSDLGPRERRERLPGAEHERRGGRTWEVSGGTLACPQCDLPVMPAVAVAIADELRCPYCGHAASARDFLTISDEPRPARVRVMATLGPGSALRV